jgi:maltose O-acetyltransferase
MAKNVAIFFYYMLLKHLPHSTFPGIGKLSEKLRYWCCRIIFQQCGRNVNIGKNARFGNGKKIEIGENSGIGMNAIVPGNIKIGKDVMMGVNVTIFGANHAFDRTDIPMISQGYKTYPPVVIEDDVWIGNNVIVLPGRIIKTGTIVAAGTVLTKDYPPYSIVGGNPSRLIKSRI